MPDFIKFPKIPRLGSKKDQMIITEKIDGTNAQIKIDDENNISVGSRNRWIYPGKQTDNYGFAQWVEDNHDELLGLGKGRWYGEWWGQGIQRRYGANRKHFSIFNTFRPIESLPSCVEQVPVLYTGEFDTTKIRDIFTELWETGSMLSDVWFEPEGIIVYQMTARQLFKMTYEYKEGKWNAT